MHPPSSYARAIALACHAALVAGLGLLAHAFGLVLALPLLAFALPLWRGQPRAYAAASLLLVFYAGGGLMEAFARSPHNPAALAIASVAALEFCALVLFVRLRAAELRRAAS